MSRRARPAAASIAVVAVAAACAHAPPAHEADAWAAFQKALGSAAGVVMKAAHADYDDEALSDYVRVVGTRVASGSGIPAASFVFVVTDDAEVNAWSHTGGFVYVSRSTVAALGSEAELAAVLGHEISHIALGHSMHSVLESVLEVPGAPGADDAPSDPDEYQADQLAMTLLQRAGYDPRALPIALRTLYATSSGLGESRDTREMYSRVVHAWRALDGRRGGETNGHAFRERIDGVVWGVDPREGVLDGRTFSCARCGFAVTVPDGWSATFEDGKLTGMAPGATPVIEAVRLGDAPAMREAVEKAAREKRFASRTIAGAPAYVGTVSGDEGPSATAFLLESSGIWSITAKGVDPAPALERILATARVVALKDFRGPLQRVRLHAAPRAGTFSEVVAAACGRPPVGVAPALLAAINARDLGERVEPGADVKCITEQ